MSILLHKTAGPAHYNKEAEAYDAFNEKNSVTINQCIETILHRHKVKTVLDLTCGTGSQVLWLTKKGFDVIGIDINSKMLAIAKTKAAHLKPNIQLMKGDMRTTQIGQFDAVITVFNAIGHLTKQDFKKAIHNINANLKPGGLYIFDIFNLNYLLRQNNITTLTIDHLKKAGNITTREIQYSTISPDGILASYDTYYTQIDDAVPKMSKASQTLQVYTKQQLRDLLQNNGFRVIKQCSIDGSRFYEYKTQRTLTIAKKLSDKA